MPYINHQIIINTYGNVIFKIILIRMLLFFEIINHHVFFQRVDNPVFTDSGCTVFEQLYAVIPLRVRGGGYFDNPVRSLLFTGTL